MPVVVPFAAELWDGELAGSLLAELVEREDYEGHDHGADGSRHPVERRADRACGNDIIGINSLICSAFTDFSA